MTSADVDDRADGHIAVAALHELELADGRRVGLLADRGWSSSAGWASASVADVVATARVVVGPDEPFGEQTPAEAVDAHWAWLAEGAQAQGATVDADELRQLPHDVVLSPRLLARIGGRPDVVRAD